MHFHANPAGSRQDGRANNYGLQHDNSFASSYQNGGPHFLHNPLSEKQFSSRGYINAGGVNPMITPGGTYVSEKKAPRRMRTFAKIFSVIMVVGCMTYAGATLFGGGINERNDGQSSNATLIQCPTTTDSSFEFEDAHVKIPKTKSGEVCALAVVKDDQETVVSRSYSGSSWERATIQSPDVRVECSPSACTFRLPPGKYSLRSVKTELLGYSVSAEKRISRFLSQATFGATRNEVQNLASEDYEGWIKQQFAETPNLHREYYRKRINPRVLMEVNTGRPYNACERHSRWRNFSIIYEDIGKIVQISGTSPSFLMVDGYPRTELTSSSGLRMIDNYEICEVDERLIGQVKFAPPGSCSGVTSSYINPQVSFSSLPSSVHSISQSAEIVELAPDVPGAMLLETVPNPCELPSSYTGPIFLRSNKGLLYIHDSRMKMTGNSISDPADFTDGGALSKCPSVPMTFVNEDTCIVGDNACSTRDFQDEMITLNEETLRLFYDVSQKYVYSVSNLKLVDVDSPCKAGTTSRWRRKNTCGANAQTDLEPLAMLLKNSNDRNLFVRDIYLDVNELLQCNTGTDVEIRISDTNECWEHVHPDLHNIYDFSYWSRDNTHPGNQIGVEPNPIKKWAANGLTYLIFPDSHGMGRWTDNKQYLKFVGRLGDTIGFLNIPEGLQTLEIAQALGFSNEMGGMSRSCGSPGEVASDPSLGARFGVVLEAHEDVQETWGSYWGKVDSNIDNENYATSTWAMIATYGKDQLRQRLAWGLSQILVIGIPSIALIYITEPYLAYYDIFVRHAFGNYRDILKEVSFSPMMGRMLSHVQSESYEYKYHRSGKDIYPDENYAREIMQLFSIGLYELNNDGTSVLDGSGNPKQSYSIDDVKSLARVWTGFDYQKYRGNIEGDGIVYETSWNLIDPMKIRSERHDRFPKMNIYGGYIGDGYPVCSDLPKQSFLRKGATYRFLGSDPTTELHDQNYPMDSPAELSSSSKLYQLLCNRDAKGDCKLRSKVVLNGDLDCDGMECNMDTIRVVKMNIGEPSKFVYFEYVRLPCVEFAFLSGGKAVSDSVLYENGAVCVNPKSPALYSIDPIDCKTLVKINEDGNVAIVHSFGSSRMPYLHVSDKSKNFFRVNWEAAFPKPSNQCRNIESCDLKTIANERYCICDTAVMETARFSESNFDRKNILRDLHIGSVPSNVDRYVLAEDQSKEKDKVRVFTPEGQINNLNEFSVFEVTDDNGKMHSLRNVISKVYIKGTEISFRNPPHFVSLGVSTARDVLYEIDATLDHYFYHKNTAPFVSYRLIQRLVSANPSPRYVDSVATAFRTGKYMNNIGSGKYGDLGATTAAILLDPEARKLVLDISNEHGKYKEPILKLFHFMRSMEVTPNEGVMLQLNYLEESIGQSPYYAPSVFSFFKPDFVPSGLLGKVGLISPESELLSSKYTVGFLNGMFSLASWGLVNCESGFGRSGDCGSTTSPSKFTPKNPYSPADVVEELDLLLTNGRLNVDSRRIIEREYKNELDMNGPESALRVAKHLFLVTPEFHTTMHSIPTSLTRPNIEQPPSSEPYKAIVYVFLDGGFDSFNALVPHSECANGKDMYKEYADVRTNIALSKESLLEISTNAPGSQVCDKFGLPPNFVNLHKRYNQGEMIFMANTGVLSNPITKEQYLNQASVGRPRNLFGHDTQTKSCQSLKPNTNPGSLSSGVVGRIMDELAKQNYRLGSYTTHTSYEALSGESNIAPEIDQIQADGSGFPNFMPNPLNNRIKDIIKELNEKQSENPFAESWSKNLNRLIDRNEFLNEKIRGVETTTNFDHFGNDLAKRLKEAARIIKARKELDSERDVLYAYDIGYDTHGQGMSQFDIHTKNIDDALNSFILEMESEGIWDSVTVVVASEFGRTLTSNGDGTDHAWGGNYFMLGGSLNGGKIIGEYPKDLTDKGDQIIDRGRVIPTTSWDSVWYGIAEWFGVHPDGISNIVNTEDFSRFTKEDLYNY